MIFRHRAENLAASYNLSNNGPEASHGTLASFEAVKDVSFHNNSFGNYHLVYRQCIGVPKGRLIKP